MSIRRAALATLTAAVIFGGLSAGSVATAGTPAAAGELFGVACPTANFCLAVGSSDALTSALVYRWDGATWSQVDAPPPPHGWNDVRFTNVSCVSDTSCVVLGDLLGADDTRLIAERWTGTSWHRLAIERPGNVGVSGLSCPGPQRCIAVGQRDRHLGHRFAPLAISWILRGGMFQLVSPARPAQSTGLRDVSCLNARNCTAAGRATTQSAHPLLEHWNGTTWHEISPEPSTPVASYLSAIDCPSPGTCIAVGAGGRTPQPRKVLIEQRRGGSAWQVRLLPYAVTDIAPNLTSVSCLSFAVCAAGGVNSDVASDKPILAWRDRSTHHFVLRQAAAWFFDVSCAGTTCTYVGTEFHAGNQLSRPVIYRGRGLHPVRQVIPLP